MSEDAETRLAGIEVLNRRHLDALNRRTKGPFSASEAEKILSLDHKRILRLLAYLATRGWLKRVRRGLYITVPLGSLNPSQRTEDPWVLASTVFAPCYIGGWSACEHWGLTEQIFNDIVVVSTKRRRTKRQSIQSFNYVVRLVPQHCFFGAQTIWRERSQVMVSDPSKTIVDGLDNPSIVGGVRHLAEIVTAYFSSEHRNDEKLVDYLQKQENGAAYKRFGYLIETLAINSAKLIDECLSRMGSGYSSLDPSLKSTGNYLKRWYLKVNVSIEPKANV